MNDDVLRMRGPEFLLISVFFFSTHPLLDSLRFSRSSEGGGRAGGAEGGSDAVVSRVGEVYAATSLFPPPTCVLENAKGLKL